MIGNVDCLSLSRLLLWRGILYEKNTSYILIFLRYFLGLRGALDFLFLSR